MFATTKTLNLCQQEFIEAIEIQKREIPYSEDFNTQ